MMEYKGQNFASPDEYFKYLLQENDMPDVLSCFEEENIDVEGSRLHLRVLRSNIKAPTVVFLPGTATYAMCYAEFLYLLYKGGVNVVGIDPRGHGQSGGTRGHYSIDSLMVDVRAVVDYAKIHFEGSIHLLGSSQGGITSLYLASEGIAVDSVICQNIADLTGRKSHRLTRFPLLSAIGKPLLSFLSRIAPRFKVPIQGYLALHKVHVKHFGNARLFMEEDPLALNHVTVQTLHSLATKSFANSLSSLQLPIMVFQGEADEIFPVPDTRDLLEEIGSSKKKLMLYPERGHGIMVNVPEEVVPDVLSWIERIDSNI